MSKKEKIVSKIINVICIFILIVGIISILAGLILQGLFLILMVFLIKYFDKKEKALKKKNDQENKVTISATTKPEEEKEENKNTIKHFYTFVTGTTHENDKGENIQNLIDGYMHYSYDSDFDTWTKADMIDMYEDRIWEYTETEYDTIKLVPQPDNRYDKNAIKVIHSSMGHIGYIPRDYNVEVKKLMDKYDLNFTINFKGGRSKYLDYNPDTDREVLKKEKTNYYIDIDIEYEENLK